MPPPARSALGRPQDEDTSLSLRELLATPRGRLTFSMDLLSLLGMAPFLAIEAATLRAYGWGWVQVRGRGGAGQLGQR